MKFAYITLLFTLLALAASAMPETQAAHRPHLKKRFFNRLAALPAVFRMMRGGNGAINAGLTARKFMTPGMFQMARGTQNVAGRVPFWRRRRAALALGGLGATGLAGGVTAAAVAGSGSDQSENDAFGNTPSSF